MEATKHCFSCEINLAKQNFIINMFQGTGMLQRVFSDALEVSSACRCNNLIYNHVEHAPLDAIDIMGGFPCQDVARCNDQRLAGASFVRDGAKQLGDSSGLSFLTSRRHVQQEPCEVVCWKM